MSKQMYSTETLKTHRAVVASSLKAWCYLCLLVIVFTSVGVTCLASSDLSVPNLFVNEIKLPGHAMAINRPSQLFYDLNFNELFVADMGNRRVLIFDSDGNYKFEFTGGGHFSTPYDIAVNSEGYIYILGQVKADKQLFKFDFDGTFITKYDFDDIFVDGEYQLESIALDADGNIYVYDDIGKQIVAIDTEGEVLGRFEILAGEEAGFRAETVVGSFAISDGLLYIPMSSLGMVSVYTLSGELVRTMGNLGSLAGQFSFPVSVAVNTDGVVLVLDERRFFVVCYAPDGKFLGEFGSSGSTLGCFYLPTLLTSDNSGNVYVGQILKNRIQKIKVPGFVLEGARTNKDDLSVSK